MQWLKNVETHLWGKMSRIWLISITVGNAGNPAPKKSKLIKFYIELKKFNVIIRNLGDRKLTLFNGDLIIGYVGSGSVGGSEGDERGGGWGERKGSEF